MNRDAFLDEEADPCESEASLKPRHSAEPEHVSTQFAEALDKISTNPTRSQEVSS